MANPIDKIKRLKGRSWTELRARGEQVFSAYKEQIGLSGKLPTDDEFLQLIDESHFENTGITKDTLLLKFFELSENSFFSSFKQKDKTLAAFRRLDSKAIAHVIEKAQKVVDGKFDLLGYQNLDFGTNFDWHYEPLSGKHIPLKHWKQFDELDTAETGDKKVIWELNRHQHFFTLGVAYWISNDEIFAETFVQHLESWMAQNPPGMGINWFSSLEVAFRSMSWLWAFQFFKNSESFTAELFEKALKFLHVHARHLEKYLSTYYSPNTHLTGEALGLYYLGTQLSFFHRAEYWRKLGADILYKELDRQIMPDGVYFEQSTWYQRYTIDFYQQFLILKSLNEKDSELELTAKTESKVQQMLDFMMYVTRPDGTTPIIGDDDGGRALPLGSRVCEDFRPILSTGAATFGRGDYKFVAGTFAEETLWLLGAESEKSFDSLKAVQPSARSKDFRDSGYFVMRDGWLETDNYLLIDCGNLGDLSGGHSHADTLAIDLAAGGRTLLVDPGTYTYHESEELRNWFRSTPAHNTLSVNNQSSSEPGAKFSWQTKAKAELNSWITDDRFDFFQGSHDGYSRFDPSTRHIRNVLFLKNDYWIMRDYVSAQDANDYTLNFHFNSRTQPEIKQAENGGFSVEESSVNENGLKIFTFGDGGEWQKRESWISTCYGRRTNAPFLQFNSSGKGSQEFYSFMLPTDALSSSPEVFETNLSGGRAFVIRYRDYNDLFVFADNSGNPIRTELFDSNFRFLWARMSAGEILPDEFVMINGTKFNINNREIINHPKNLSFAVARRWGNKLNVRTNESVFSVSLPRKRSRAFILKPNS